MAGFSTYLQQKVLDHVLGDTAYTMPTTYVALFTANPTDAGGGTEANYTGYARVAASGKFGAASGTSKSNTSAVTFGACTAGSNTITGFGIYDASSAGNLLAWGTCSLSVSSGITPSFAASALTVTLD